MLVHSRVYIDAIVVGERKRPVDEERVTLLAKSMEALGLQQPISIWAEKDEIEGAPDTLRLVAGMHRLRAAEKLGWEQIDAVYVDLNDLDRRRWEIAENLHRSELTSLQRDQHVAEWIKLTEEAEQKQKVDLPQSEAKPKPGRKKGGTRAAARELGIEQEDARRAVKVASLTDEAKETAREVHLDDNRSALLQAAKEAPERQSQALREIAAAKLRAKQAPAPPVEEDEDDDPEWTDENETGYANWDAQPEHVKRQWVSDNWKLCLKVLSEQGRI